MKKLILLSCGYISLTLGIIGIVVPLLPTTPFILLASACFVRSSTSLNRWLLNHRVFGNYIYAFQHFHAISKKSKVTALFLLWICIVCSCLFVVSVWWIRILLIIIAISVSIYLLSFKTLTNEMNAKLRDGSKTTKDVSG